MSTPTREEPHTMVTRRKIEDGTVLNFSKLPANFQLTKRILKNHVCRLCATYYSGGPNILPLFDTYKGVIIMSKIVNSLMVVEVVKGDGLPEVICKKCTDQLIAWYKMRITSVEVNRILEVEAQSLGSPDAVNSNIRQITYHLVDLLDSSDDEDGAPALRPSRLVVHRRLPAVVPLLQEVLHPPPPEFPGGPILVLSDAPSPPEELSVQRDLSISQSQRFDIPISHASPNLGMSPRGDMC